MEPFGIIREPVGMKFSEQLTVGSFNLLERGAKRDLKVFIILTERFGGWWALPFIGAVSPSPGCMGSCAASITAFKEIIQFIPGIFHILIGTLSIK